MSCNSCNSSVITCDSCNDTHLECHPCYASTLQTCTNTATNATPIPECVNPDYCAEGCDETMESGCINTSCGTLDTVIDLLIDPVTCLPLAVGSSDCDPLGVPGNLTYCIETLSDIKADFLAANPTIDATGEVKFISGPQPITTYPVTWPEIGTYVFEYGVYTTCYNAQVINVTVNTCAAIDLVINSFDCVDGTIMFAGTYTTSGAVPTLVITSGQTATNISIAAGVITFEITETISNQLITFYLQNEVQSNIINTALQVCEECTLDIVETQGGCENTLSVSSITDGFFEKVDTNLTADSISFNYDYNCELNSCGSPTYTAGTVVGKLETNVTVDYSGFIDGVSYIKSMDLISNVTGAFTITFDPLANPALLYDASAPSVWESAVNTELQNQLTLLGYTAGTDYLYFFFTPGQNLSFNFRVKHGATGEWVGFDIGNSQVQYVLNNGSATLVDAGFGATDISITCTDTDACGNTLSIQYTIDNDNIDYPASNYNNIVLSSPYSSLTLVSDTNASSFCALEIALTAIGTGCAVPTYLWSPGGETTATITNVSPGTYSVTATCADCVETASYEIVASIDCNTIPQISYDCRVVTCSTEFDTVTITGFGVVTNGQVVYIPDNTYTVVFSKLGCPDKTAILTVGCIPYWIETEVVYGYQVCVTTFSVAPINQNNYFSIAFLTNSTTPPTFSLTYNTGNVGDIYSFDEGYSIKIISIAANGVMTFESYATTGASFIIDVIDYSSPIGQSLITDIC